MKWYELGLIGLGGYLLFRSVSAAPEAAVSGTGGYVPGTTIAASPGFVQKAAEVNATAAQAKAPLTGGIVVKSAPYVENTAPIVVVNETKKILGSAYTAGKFVPSSFLSGHLTATDIVIANNLKASMR